MGLRGTETLKNGSQPAPAGRMVERSIRPEPLSEPPRPERLPVLKDTGKIE
jgi:hypothetical protein